MTNGSLFVFGDGRSAGARRYRDLLAAFAVEVGGMDALPTSGQQVIRRLAQVSVELEIQEAQRASGQVIDPAGFCSLVNAQRRLLRDLARLKPSTRREPTLAETLAAERLARDQEPKLAA